MTKSNHEQLHSPSHARTRSAGGCRSQRWLFFYEYGCRIMYRSSLNHRAGWSASFIHWRGAKTHIYTHTHAQSAPSSAHTHTHTRHRIFPGVKPQKLGLWSHRWRMGSTSALCVFLFLRLKCVCLRVSRPPTTNLPLSPPFYFPLHVSSKHGRRSLRLCKVAAGRWKPRGALHGGAEQKISSR